MLEIRRAAERGHFDHGWLDTRHTFSFGGYHDPAHMRFRALRVMNEDVVAPGAGFGMHAHHDMEIVTLVRAGALAHRDSLGNSSVLRTGELQRMTAGSGIEHSEFNPSAVEAAHFHQVWIVPERRGLAPGYEQRAFDATLRRDAWQLVASQDGADGSLRIMQDARILLADLSERAVLDLPVAEGRHFWLQVLSGRVSIGGAALAEGDGAHGAAGDAQEVRADSFAELMLFDLS